MNKKQAVRATLEELDAEAQRQQEEREREEIRKRQDKARPSLIKRIGIGLLDFVFAAAFAGACFAFSYFVLFEPLGYNLAAKTIIDEHQNSGLFVVDGGNFVTLKDKYDGTVDPVKYYDVPITNYYKTDARAVEQNKLSTYVQAKLDSTYFELNGEGQCVAKEGVNKEFIKATLETEYTKAYNFFYDSPTLNAASKKTYYTITVTILVCVTLSSIAFYIVVPIVDKRRRTFAYMIAKVEIIDKNSNELITLKRAMIRNVVFVVIVYICAVTLYILTGEIFFSTIPLFINTVLMCLTHSNSGMHDIAGECTIVNRSRCNAISVLESIKQMGKNQ